MLLKFIQGHSVSAASQMEMLDFALISKCLPGNCDTFHEYRLSMIKDLMIWLSKNNPLLPQKISFEHHYFHSSPPSFDSALRDI